MKSEGELFYDAGIYTYPFPQFTIIALQNQTEEFVFNKFEKAANEMYLPSLSVVILAIWICIDLVNCKSIKKVDEFRRNKISSEDICRQYANNARDMLGFTEVTNTLIYSKK